MLMCKMQSHFKAIKNILNTLKQFLKIGRKIINAIMNDMGMNHSLHIGTCIMQNALNFMQSLHFLNRPQ